MTDVATPARAVRTPEPLTERVLGWLGEPEWLWALLWAGVSVVRPIVLFVTLAASARQLTIPEWTTVIITQLAIGWTTLVGFWGIRRISRGARALAPDLASLAEAETTVHVFPGMTSTLGPVALTVGLVVVPSFVSSWQHWGPIAALGDLPLVVVNSLPSMTFVWTYLVLLAGLHRLGRARLSLDPFPEDRSLGLGSVGSLALTGFWLLLLGAVPLIVAGSADLPTVLLSLSVVAASVALFFLSMFRVHRQMADAKQRYLEIARELYREAYQPVREQPNLKTLQGQSDALPVAHALVERAEDILEWPIDERATAWVVVVITGVTTALIVRLILSIAEG